MSAAGAPALPSTQLRSAGRVLTAGEIYALSKGITEPAPSVNQSSIAAIFAHEFASAPVKKELYLLDSFAMPHLAIQPAIIPSSVTASTVPASLEPLSTIIIERDTVVFPPGANTSSLQYDSLVSGYEFNPVLLANVKESYEATNKASDVPFYMLLLTNFGHASIMIYSEGTLYSIGLGLDYGSYGSALDASSGAGGKRPSLLEALFTGRSDFIADSKFLSPDNLVTPRKLHPKKRVPFDYRIVDVGLFKTKHVRRIMNLVPTKGPHTMQTSFGLVDPLDKPTAKRNEYEFQGYTIDLKKKYMLLSSATAAEKLGTFFNCVSFAQYVFKERIDCSTSVGIVDPRLCKSKAGHDTRDLFNKFITTYINGGIIESFFAELDDGHEMGGAAGVDGSSLRTNMGGGKARNQNRRSRKTMIINARRQNRRSRKTMKRNTRRGRN